MDLTTVAQVKSFLRIPSANNTDDGLLQLLVNGAVDAILNEISRDVLSRQYTEVRDGTGTNTVMLANFPVTAVGSVSITAPRSFAGAPAQTTPLIEGVDYAVTQYSVKLYGGCFPRGVANVMVEYTAGFRSYPGDLVMAATKYAAIRYRETDRLGQKSKALQNETVTFDLSELPPDVLAICNRYQSKIPMITSPLGRV